MIWNIQFWFEIEYEVEIVSKTNLKRFIKYVLKGNRWNIYNIYIIYIMAWIERAAPRQFTIFDRWLRMDITGDLTVGFSWNQNRWVRIEKRFPMNIRNLKSNGWIWNYVQIKFGKGRCKCSSMAVDGIRLYGPW